MYRLYTYQGITTCKKAVSFEDSKRKATNKEAVITSWHQCIAMAKLDVRLLKRSVLNTIIEGVTPLIGSVIWKLQRRLFCLILV